ncbi:MAG: GreA/GreB family elongation factor [Mycobacterium sp.]
MTTAQRVWLTPQAYDGLQNELTTLRALLAADVEPADEDENTVAVQQARRARMQRIHDLLLNASVGEDPADDGVAEPGMVLTVRFDDTEDTETFLLGVRGAEYGDLEVYSVKSPLGEALLGARPGQRRQYEVPSGGMSSVTLVKAVPYGMHKTEL